jgi:hypothetical protein
MYVNTQIVKYSLLSPPHASALRPSLIVVPQEMQDPMDDQQLQLCQKLVSGLGGLGHCPGKGDNHIPQIALKPRWLHEGALHYVREGQDIRRRFHTAMAPIELAQRLVASQHYRQFTCFGNILLAQC